MEGNMKPFMLVEKYKIIVGHDALIPWGVITPKTMDEAVAIQQRLEYQKGVASVIQVNQSYRSLVRSV
jgi:hypothetical protein